MRTWRMATEEEETHMKFVREVQDAIRKLSDKDLYKRDAWLTAPCECGLEGLARVILYPFIQNELERRRC